MKSYFEAGDMLMDNNHKLVCKIVSVCPTKFHKYNLESENGEQFCESEPALLSQRYTLLETHNT